MTKEDWYSNKDLFEMMQVFQTQVSQLTKEMSKTTVLIRDYNGLRGTINDVDKRVGEVEQLITINKDNSKTKRQSRSNCIAWFFAFLMFIMSLLQYFN